MQFRPLATKKKWYLYQNQSIGRELTAPDTNCKYSKVTLSLKKSDMIKSDRFWHRIIKFKTVAGLRRSLICSNSKAFNLWQGWGLRICNSNFAQLLHCIQRSYYAAATPLLDRQLLVLSLGRLWRPSSNSINGRLRVENVLSSLASLRSAPHA